MDKIKLFESVLNKYNSLEKEWAQENRSTGKYFNSLRLFDIQETTHSYLLAYLLNPTEGHGQGGLFLKHFLKLLHVEYSEDDFWVITAEKGRIDILLKRVGENSCTIVIENKSNNADDQPNQLYRYWYQEIYLPNRLKESAVNEDNVHIIYLTPSEDKQPADNTFERPSGLNESLPKRIPKDSKIFKIWYFGKHIKQWLAGTLDDLPKNNHRLSEFVEQYIELWN